MIIKINAKLLVSYARFITILIYKKSYFNLLMKNILITILVCLIFAGCKNSKSVNEKNKLDSISQLNPLLNSEWAKNKFWDDGKAEVAQYKAKRIIYKKERDFEYTMVTVSEVFNKEFLTKTDDYSRKDNFDVMKVNFIARIETDNYPYHFLTSYFTFRNNPEYVFKFTNSSQEWCGNTFKEILKSSKGYTINYHSYWDGEGSGNKTINDNVWLEDQLFLTLRTLKFNEVKEFKHKVLESQISSKIGKLIVFDANFTISNSDSIIINNQNYTTYKVKINLDSEKVNEYVFTKEYPNYLVSYNSWDGRSLILNKVERDDYWNF